MEYEVIKYRPEFKSQVVELQRHLWSPDPVLNAVYLEWKYERNPYQDTPLIYLALCAGKVVGMRGMCGAQWQLGHPDRTFLGLCACDLVIAPDHRNRGLFTKIMRAALNDLANHGTEYVFNLSASPITFVGSLAKGWRSIGSLQMVSRQAEQRLSFRRVRRFVARLPVLWRYAETLPFLYSAEERTPFCSLDRNSARPQREASPFVRVERHPQPEAMAELVKRIGSDGRIRQVRDQQYFSWRFQNPLSVYRFLFWEDSQLEGYLVLEKSVSRHADRARVNIMDWEATDKHVWADLLHAAIRLGDFEEMVTWSVSLHDVPKKLLQEMGFTTLETGRMTRYRPCVLVRPVRDEMLKADWVLFNCRLLDLANWDLRLLYSL